MLHSIAVVTRERVSSLQSNPLVCLFPWRRWSGERDLRGENKTHCCGGCCMEMRCRRSTYVWIGGCFRINSNLAADEWWWHDFYFSFPQPWRCLRLLMRRQSSHKVHSERRSASMSFDSVYTPVVKEISFLDLNQGMLSNHLVGWSFRRDKIWIASNSPPARGKCTSLLTYGRLTLLAITL